MFGAARVQSVQSHEATANFELPSLAHSLRAYQNIRCIRFALASIASKHLLVEY